MYKAIITKLTNVRPHSNADRLKLATVCGNQVVVGLNNTDGELGVFFDVDGQLSHEFCHNNNLYRDKTKNKDTSKSGMFDDNRKIRAQKFRGEKSEGFWIPLDSLNYLTMQYKLEFSEGDEFTHRGKDEICRKYINPNTLNTFKNKSTDNKNSLESVMFKRHMETEQFGRNLHKIDRNSKLTITEKLHGTSQRVGYVLVEKPLSTLKMLINRFKTIYKSEYEWKYLVGSRNIVLTDNSKIYHDKDFRNEAAKPFINNLKKGETVFYEVVGFEKDSKTIMPECSNTKLKPFLDKDEYDNVIKQFGENTRFDYGKNNGFQIFVYRITLTNEDGFTIDYSWDQVKTRCKELGVRYVPELISDKTKQDIAQIECVRNPKCDGRYNIEDDRDINNLFLEHIKLLANDHLNSLMDYGHIREGVCIRVEDGFNPLILKEKSFYFKILEGIIKDSGVVDTEESS